MLPNNLPLSKKLRDLRISHGYTQKYIGDYLNITRQGYAHYEKGGRTPDNQTLIKLASLYNLSIDELINSKLIPSTIHEESAYSTYNRQNAQSLSSFEAKLIQYIRQLPSNTQQDILEYVKFRLYKNPKQ
ncbi:helix-turn-helix transcriptional regulator [Anaerosporobacter faecicola]|uniref:helix-turn-helix transcriptional regulator n=1 Tax=Anaerosporobacter faecicola TaxID=2718714 RepID=UPI001438F9EE|nr:helix-turn-helix transcriptional regulator [Anaerosporobacter faecicola]